MEPKSQKLAQYEISKGKLALTSRMW